MVYIFSELDKIEEEIFQKWLQKVPLFRREKVLQYRFYADRVRSLCAYCLLCAGIGERVGAFTLGHHGKPYFPAADAYFNISHGENCVAVGLSDTEIGVDVEKIRKYPSEVLKRVFTSWEIQQIFSSENPDESFFRFWTLKESYIKALGRGLSFPLQEVEFTFLPERIQCSDERYIFDSQKIDDHIISICDNKKHPVQVWNLRQFTEEWEKLK